VSATGGAGGRAQAPRTRSVRIIWLLEELEIPYALERVAFAPPAKRFFEARPAFARAVGAE